MHITSNQSMMYCQLSAEKKPKRQYVEWEKNAFKIDDYKIVYFIGFTLLSKWHYEMYLNCEFI